MGKRELPAALTSLLKELTRQIYIGRTHLLIWENLNSYLVKNREVEKMAPAFLGLTLIAHKDEALLYLGRLYDKRSGTATLDFLVKQACSYAGLSVDQQYLKQTLDMWESKKKELEKDVEKLRDYRNKFLAHLDKARIVNPVPIREDEKLTLGIA